MEASTNDKNFKLSSATKEQLVQFQHQTLDCDIVIQCKDGCVRAHSSVFTPKETVVSRESSTVCIRQFKTEDVCAVLAILYTDRKPKESYDCKLLSTIASYLGLNHVELRIKRFMDDSVHVIIDLSPPSSVCGSDSDRVDEPSVIVGINEEGAIHGKGENINRKRNSSGTHGNERFSWSSERRDIDMNPQPSTSNGHLTLSPTSSAVSKTTIEPVEDDESDDDCVIIEEVKATPKPIFAKPLPGSYTPKIEPSQVSNDEEMDWDDNFSTPCKSLKPVDESTPTTARRTLFGSLTPVIKDGTPMKKGDPDLVIVDVTELVTTPRTKRPSTKQLSVSCPTSSEDTIRQDPQTRISPGAAPTPSATSVKPAPESPTATAKRPSPATSPADDFCLPLSDIVNKSLIGGTANKRPRVEVVAGPSEKEMTNGKDVYQVTKPTEKEPVKEKPQKKNAFTEVRGHEKAPESVQSSVNPTEKANLATGVTVKTETVSTSEDVADVGSQQDLLASKEQEEENDEVREMIAELNRLAAKWKKSDSQAQHEENVATPIVPTTASVSRPELGETAVAEKDGDSLVVIESDDESEPSRPNSRDARNDCVMAIDELLELDDICNLSINEATVPMSHVFDTAPAVFKQSTGTSNIVIPATQELSPKKHDFPPGTVIPATQELQPKTQAESSQGMANNTIVQVGTLAVTQRPKTPTIKDVPPSNRAALPIKQIQQTKPIQQQRTVERPIRPKPVEKPDYAPNLKKPWDAQLREQVADPPTPSFRNSASSKTQDTTVPISSNTQWQSHTLATGQQFYMRPVRVQSGNVATNGVSISPNVGVSILAPAPVQQAFVQRQPGPGSAPLRNIACRQAAPIVTTISSNNQTSGTVTNAAQIRQFVQVPVAQYEAAIRNLSPGQAIQGIRVVLPNADNQNQGTGQLSQSVANGGIRLKFKVVNGQTVITNANHGPAAQTPNPRVQGNVKSHPQVALAPRPGPNCSSTVAASTSSYFDPIIAAVKPGAPDVVTTSTPRTTANVPQPGPIPTTPGAGTPTTPAPRTPAPRVKCTFCRKLYSVNSVKAHERSCHAKSTLSIENKCLEPGCQWPDGKQVTIPDLEEHYFDKHGLTVKLYNK